MSTVRVGLTFKEPDGAIALVQELFNLEQWGVGNFTLEGSDAIGQNFKVPYRPGDDRGYNYFLEFVNDCQFVFPVTVTSLRGTGVVF